MSFKGLLPKIVLLGFSAIILSACDSHNRNTSPNYHINAMERQDAHPYCHACESRVPKDWNKDK